MSGFWGLVIFFFFSSFITWLFKYAAGLFEGVVMLPWLKGNGLEIFIEKHPKKFIVITLLKNVIIGLAFSTVIMFVTAEYVVKTQGNIIIYIIYSLIWSLTLLKFTPSFRWVFFSTSTLTLILYWLNFGAFAWTLVGIFTYFISLAYYLGKVDVINSKERDQFF